LAVFQHAKAVFGLFLSTFVIIFIGCNNKDNDSNLVASTADSKTAAEKVSYAVDRLLKSDTVYFYSLSEELQDLVRQDIVGKKIYPFDVKPVDPPPLLLSLPDCGGLLDSILVA